MDDLEYLQDALPLLPMGVALVCRFHKGVWTVNFCKSVYAWDDTVIGELTCTDADFTRAVLGLRDKVNACQVLSEDVRECLAMLHLS